MYGELVPVGGGDNIPLTKQRLTMGRRESNDIVLRFQNVSAHHCEMQLESGYWFIRDLNSSNGVKVNGVRVKEKRLDPGDHLSVAKHDYRVHYSPADLGAVGLPPNEQEMASIFGKSLLERAGLAIGKKGATEAAEQLAPNAHRDMRRRYDVLNDKPDQIKRPDQGV